MNYAEISLVGAILAVDATIYSFSYGLVLRERRWMSAWQLACVVGIYQALMPLLGYVGGVEVRDIAVAWNHWIVLTVFCCLGGSIIYQAWMKNGDALLSGTMPLRFLALMLVGLATSIDALVVGVCMALGNIGGLISGFCMLVVAVFIIGSITFVASLAAFHLARLLHHLPSRWLETLAGVLLIALGGHHVFLAW